MLSSSSAVACPQFSAHICAQEARVARALQNYPIVYRSAVKQTAARDFRLADLALSFPALLFAIAVPHRNFDREALAQSVLAGVPLKALAQMAVLPYWLRKLPPQAFDAPIGPLPDGAFIQRQIGNYLPTHARNAARWLSRVSYAMEWGHEAFAVWVASLTYSEKGQLNKSCLRKLALWAWASTKTDTQMGALCSKPWHMRLSLTQAIGFCDEWVEQVNLHLLMKVRQQPPKFRAAMIDGYEFVHLATPMMIAEEANRMRNCVRGYGYDVAYFAVELWSMRKDCCSIATISVGECPDDGLATITQIKAIDNKQVGRDVALAARRWVQLQDIAAMEFEDIKEQARDCEKAWRELFKPYWIEKRATQRWPKLTPKSYRLSQPWLIKRARW